MRLEILQRVENEFDPVPFDSLLPVIPVTRPPVPHERPT